MAGDHPGAWADLSERSVGADRQGVYVSNDSNTLPGSDSIQLGRRAHLFVPLPEWIIVAGLSPQALSLYTVLLAHVNRQRGDGTAWPGLSVLAELLGYSKRQSVTPYIRELTGVGAIDVEQRKCATGRRNVYTLHELPPDGYAGLRSLAEFYVSREIPEPLRNPSGKAPEGGMSAPADIGMSAGADEGWSAGADMNHTNRTRRSEQDESTSSDACAAGAPRTSSRGDKVDQHGRPKRMCIHVPKDFERLDEDEVPRQLVAAAVKASRTVGVELSEDAKSEIGKAIKHAYSEVDRREVARMLEVTLNQAVEGRNKWAWIFDDARAS